jgi:hypothetical protein
MHIIDGGDVGGGRVDQSLQSGKHRIDACLDRCGGKTGQAAEVPALVGVEQ